MSDTDDQPTYNGRYEVQRRIARGGMADVFLARDLLLARPVAVKVLFPEFASDPSFVARFRREAQAAANLNHPNVVGVYDWGQEGGTYYIVMEFIDGRSLSEVLRTQGSPPAAAAAGIAADVAAALGFAHRNGVVHRDIKPGNIMITDAGHVKVADFGIARAMTASAEDNLTQTGSVMGTATYFSPEQAQGHTVDQRSDLYSLGVVMYELANGRPPFVADSPIAVAYKHVQEPPTPLRERNPGVPEGYEAITMKLLAKQPGGRYRDADALRADLRRFSEGERVAAPDPAAVGAAALAAGVPTDEPTTSAGAVSTVGPAPAYVQGSGRRTGWFVALLVLLLAALGGLLLLFANTLGIGDETPTVAVPNVENKPFTEAQTILEDADLQFESTRRPDAEVPNDRVISQDPGAGADVEEGSVVQLVVSSGPPGPEVKPVPDVVSLTEDDARQKLRDAGFTVVDDSEEFSETVPEGAVISQSPAPNTEVAVNSPITIVVSGGPEPTTAPPETDPPETDPPETDPPETDPPPPTSTEPPPTSTEPPPTSSSTSTSTTTTAPGA